MVSGFVQKRKVYEDPSLDIQISDLVEAANRLVVSDSSEPPAGKEWRGVTWISRGGSGVADTMKICLKSAADTYSWKTITTG